MLDFLFYSDRYTLNRIYVQLNTIKFKHFFYDRTYVLMNQRCNEYLFILVKSAKNIYIDGVYKLLN